MAWPWRSSIGFRSSRSSRPTATRRSCRRAPASTASRWRSSARPLGRSVRSSCEASQACLSCSWRRACRCACWRKASPAASAISSSRRHISSLKASASTVTTTNTPAGARAAGVGAIARLGEQGPATRAGMFAQLGTPRIARRRVAGRFARDHPAHPACRPAWARGRSAPIPPSWWHRQFPHHIRHRPDQGHAAHTSCPGRRRISSTAVALVISASARARVDRSPWVGLFAAGCAGSCAARRGSGSCGCRRSSRIW
ncbi:hypothetical protein RLIN73S_00826 [Rhodanobacter lindaniclasticus]